MQRLDDAKRQAILRTAAWMFSRRSFHEVKLDDVAAQARIGKGTVYIYFKSKEDLYESLILQGFDDLIEHLQALSSSKDSIDTWTTLQAMVVELVAWAHGNPHFFNMIRQASAERVPKFRRKRRELGKQFETVLRRGVKRREIVDPLPGLTAQFIPALARSAIRFGPGNLPPAKIAAHIMHVLGGGIRRGQ